MSNPNQHDLLGYLVDALEPREHEQIERQLRDDPALREELRRLRAGLELLRDDDLNCEPLPGLARRACAFVARHRESTVEVAASEQMLAAHAKSLPLAPANVERQPPFGHSWRFVDVAVALGVCLAGVAMLFPILSNLQANARITTCQNKLREIGMALAEYSQHQNGYFPRVDEKGPLAAGGVYAPRLVAGGYITDPSEFLCPGAELPADAAFRVPTLDELQTARDDQIAELRRSMGGSYGYTLGYRENGVYRPTRNLGRETFAIAADVPAADGRSSHNHGQKGHNVLLEDGHVAQLTTTRMLGSTDDIFMNDAGQIGAGCNRNDAVIVPSSASP